MAKRRVPMTVKPRFFATADTFRRWLKRNHDRCDELWVGFYKKSSGRKAMNYREALDQALCFGWIDGRINAVDELSYRVRFTPRKRSSNWSRVNILRFAELKQSRLIATAGQKAFDRRDRSRSEDEPPELPCAFKERFQKKREAWRYFMSQPLGYRRLVTWWVLTAKRESTRGDRLERLIRSSGRGERVALGSTPKKKKGK